MISNGPLWRASLGLGVAFGLGLAALSLPASAAVGGLEPSLSLQATEGATPLQAPSGDDGALSGSTADAPLVVADDSWKNNRTWNPNAHVQKNWNKNWNNKNWNNNWNHNYAHKNWKKKNNVNIYVRTWRPRPYYGQFFGGIVLGSILTAAAIGIAPPPPNPGLCWYWADPYGYRGYWDYCAPYPPY